MEDLDACSYLAWCGSLHHLTLAGNPVAEEENYHSEVGSSWSCPGSEPSSQHCQRLHPCGPAASMDWLSLGWAAYVTPEVPSIKQDCQVSRHPPGLRSLFCCAALCSSLAPPGGSRGVPAAGVERCTRPLCRFFWVYSIQYPCCRWPRRSPSFRFWMMWSCVLPQHQRQSMHQPSPAQSLLAGDLWPSAHSSMVLGCQHLRSSSLQEGHKLHGWHPCCHSQ